MELLHKEITEQIIGAAFEVYRHLGYGFLEKVYQRAMYIELTRAGLKVVMEAPLKACYKGECVGEYEAGLFVEDKVMVELKVAPDYRPGDEPQFLNELKATRVKVGLLINFGRGGVEFKRRVF